MGCLQEMMVFGWKFRVVLVRRPNHRENKTYQSNKRLKSPKVSPILPASKVIIAILNPIPGSPSRFSSGTKQSSNMRLQVLEAVMPSLSSFLPRERPRIENNSYSFILKQNQATAALLNNCIYPRRFYNGF